MQTFIFNRSKSILYLLSLVFVGAVSASDLLPKGKAWTMKTNIVVTSSGIHLADVVVPPDNVLLPHYKVSDAPQFGSTAIVQQSFVNDVLQKVLSINAGTNWVGAPQVLVTRRARAFNQDDMLALLNQRISAEYLSTGGELELRMSRAWNEIMVPDESFEMNIISMPPQGVMASFRVRFELRTALEKIGTWELSIRANLWKEVWVARQRLTRGNVLLASDVVRERRDILAGRDHVVAEDMEILPNGYELTENIREGYPLKRWSVREKPSVYRGQMADALVSNGSLRISLKVQVLEDGVKGQNIRIRNPHTKRELIGKVNHDQTIHIHL